MKYAVYSQPVEVRHKLPPLGSLTAIRFVAAMHVVLFHESHWTGHIVFFPLAARIVNSGYTSVTLFFVLSGFILAYNYERVRSRRDFWVARFARIYPVYFLSLLPPLLITPHWSYHPHPGPLGLALTFCLLQAWWPPLAFSLNQAAWTLSVEALFYASFPFLLPWIQGLRRQTFILLQMAYLLLLCLPALMGLKVSTASAGFQFAVWLEGTFPLVRLDAFVLGGLCRGALSPVGRWASESESEQDPWFAFGRLQGLATPGPRGMLIGPARGEPFRSASAGSDRHATDLLHPVDLSVARRAMGNSE